MNSKEVRVFWDKVEKEEKVKGLKNILDDLDVCILFFSFLFFLLLFRIK